MGTDTYILPGLLTYNYGFQHQIGLRCLLYRNWGAISSPLHGSPWVGSHRPRGGHHHLRRVKGAADFTVPLQQLLVDLGLCSLDMALTTEGSVRGFLGEPEKKLDDAIMRVVVGVEK